MQAAMHHLLLSSLSGKITECLRRLPGCFVKNATEIRLILKSHLMGDNPNILCRVQEQFLGLQDAVAV
jgi:hypothetical protein